MDFPTRPHREEPSKPADDNRAFAEFLARHGSEWVRVCFPDANGIARGKIVPAAKMAKSGAAGLAVPRSVLVQDAEGENSPVEGFDFASGDADFLGIPDLSTLSHCPWKPGTSQVLLDARDPSTGAPLGESCRTVLARAVDRLAAHGLTAMVASELEFYLFQPGYKPVSHGKPAYSLMAKARLAAVIDQLMEGTAAVGLEPEGCLHEYAPGQLEINFSPADPLAMADRTFLFRQMVKEVALLHGLEATFMAKPLADQSGSGYHVHASLWRGADNAFVDPATGGPSAMLHQFVRGNVEHAPDLMALFAPNVNSYRRHVLGEYVPNTASWGGDDRTVALRIPAATGKATRVEHRVAGADANPHALLAAILLAGLDGIERDVAPLDPATRGQTGTPFPNSLPDALARLSASAFAREALGDGFLKVFLAVKGQEWRKFQETIGEWELRVFGSAL